MVTTISSTSDDTIKANEETTTIHPNEQQQHQHHHHQPTSTNDTTTSTITTTILKRIQIMFGCTYYAISIYRIVFGILLMIELILRYQYLYPFYSNYGTLPINILLKNVDTLYQYICLPYCYYNELYQQQILLFIQIVCSIYIIFGIYGSNIICCISLYLYISLSLRNTWLNYILDRYIYYCLFILMLLPHNQYYSIQSYYKNKKNQKYHKNNKNNQSANVISVSDWYISPATISIKLLLLWIYYDAGYGKFTNQGWSYNAYPLPALDTYARHTLIAQYMTAIWGTIGWRILTPIVVYIELLVVPLTLISLFCYNTTMIYTCISLIVSLHLGIASTIRNATLLSFIAISPWTTFLPITTKKYGNTNNTIHTVSVQTSNRFTTIGTLLLIIPLISGNIWFELYSKSCDQSVKHIWSTILHNRWNVFIGAEEYVTWEIAPGLLYDNTTIVDIWKDSTTVDWTLPTIQSGGAPSTATARIGRWRSFPYLADFDDTSDEYHALWGYLCKEWDMKHPHPSQKLIQYNFFMLQADILPNMQFSATRKRKIVSYNCSNAYMERNSSNNINTISDPATTKQESGIVDNTGTRQDTNEIDYPKASETTLTSNEEPESIESEYRIELAPYDENDNDSNHNNSHEEL